MASPIIKIKRGTTVPSAGQLQAGEFGIDQAAKNLYLGIEVGGVVTNEVVGGNGTFATHADVATAVANATSSLGTMSTQNANSVAITGGSISGVTLNVTGPIIDLAGGALVNVPSPTNLSDPANKFYVDTVVSNLGSVFHYVGDVSSASTPLDLTTLSDQATGAYYRVDVDGAYTNGATTFNAKVGDAFVKTTTNWQKIDNVDAVVSGTTNEIVVNGTDDTGYTVSIDPVFSGRVTTIEGNLTVLGNDVNTLFSKTQNIDSATTAGTTKVNGKFEISHGVYSTIFNDSNGGIVTTAPVIVNNPQGIAVDKIESFNGGLTLSGSGGEVFVSNATSLKGSGTTTLEGFVIDGGVY